MEKQQRAALVYAGPVRRSSLTRLPGLAYQLKYIKSSSVATASRAVSALRAGQAVRRYEELAGADLILISVPDAAVARVVSDLAASQLEWKGRTVALFDSAMDTSALLQLKARGAHVATLNWSAHPERFFAEGSAAGLKRIRTLTGKRSLLVLTSKAMYLKAEMISRDGFFPMLASTVELFRKAGMEKAAAEQTAAALFTESIRAWLRAGRRLLNVRSKRRA